MTEPEKSTQVEVTVAPADGPDKTEMAKQAIQMVLGSNNDYLMRLLVDKLDGKERTFKRIPLSQLVHGKDRDELRQQLSAKTSEAQKAVVEKFTTNQGNTLQAVSSWLLNTVLTEKLKDREVRESSDYWKYVNGFLAVILPVGVGLLQHYLSIYFGTCECGSSN
jgi:hypothetical protein